jgi:hypothetical protein
MSNYELRVVNRNIGIALNNLGKGLPLLMIVLFILTLCLYQIIRIWSYHRKQVKDKVNARKRMNLMVSISTPHASLNDAKNSIHDNYGNGDKDSKTNLLDDEFARMSQTIQTTFAQYKDYNDKMSKFYQDNHNKDAPDTINVSVLNRSNDNY